ncbi:mitochondrial protein C2orf69 homolog isoform X2 [Cylas formicarius]|uniref:mitochondrial protein C2orf69 homolog isoform X2 n=1 Tax=Cylas formicarius TaxID=197179 RepID=UPI002958C06C|nr:mitochondrial protein C2orf69 homolog isoform X2 [Cylas formicarius]XP_060527138.1 mitochondrial protein C2orf69 homolog isoform X2 [Cylas formicarius]
MGSEVQPGRPLRLLQVEGFEARKNDVVYCPSGAPSTPPTVAAVFPGDVQDFTENMEAHRDNRRHKQWNLERTAQVIQRHFPECHVLVIKPSRMDFKTFSCFQNFVKSDQLGVPDHTPNHNSLRHLDRLIKNASCTLQESSDSELEEALRVSAKALGESGNAPDGVSICRNNFYGCPLKLIGFSKGCVVLNQFLHEFHHFKVAPKEDEEVFGVMARIEDMYWLDGGHSGGTNTWVTSKTVLETLASSSIRVHVHVTPYQIDDDRRPWIKKEEKTFSDTLVKLGCDIKRSVHFEGVPPTLLTHFEVLNAFS